MVVRYPQLIQHIRKIQPNQHSVLVFCPNLAQHDPYVGCPNQLFLFGASLPGAYVVLDIPKDQEESLHVFLPWPSSSFERLASWESSQHFPEPHASQPWVKHHRLPQFKSDLSCFYAFCSKLSKQPWWQDAAKVLHLFDVSSLAEKPHVSVLDEMGYSSPLLTHLFLAAVGPKVSVLSQGLSEWILQRRQHKDEYEQKCVTESVKLALVAHEKARRLLAAQRGDEATCTCSDIDVASVLRAAVLGRSQDEGFAPIVLAGSRGSDLHGVLNGSSVCSQDSVIIDFGARYQGYQSDITRSYVWGKKAKAVYKRLLGWYHDVMGLLQPGLTWSALNSQARAIAEKKYPEFLPLSHSVGHHIGLMTHDPEWEPFRAGDTIALELGYYPKQRAPFAFRIEDNFIITPEGARCLSDSLDRSGKVSR